LHRFEYRGRVVTLTGVGPLAAPFEWGYSIKTVTGDTVHSRHDQKFATAESAAAAARKWIDENRARD